MIVEFLKALKILKAELLKISQEREGFGEFHPIHMASEDSEGGLFCSIILPQYSKTYSNEELNRLDELNLRWRKAWRTFFHYLLG